MYTCDRNLTGRVSVGVLSGETPASKCIYTFNQKRRLCVIHSAQIEPGRVPGGMPSGETPASKCIYTINQKRRLCVIHSAQIKLACTSYFISHWIMLLSSSHQLQRRPPFRQLPC